MSVREVRDHLVKFVMSKPIELIFLEIKPIGEERIRFRVMVEKNYRYEVCIVFNYKQWTAKAVSIDVDNRVDCRRHLYKRQYT
jgi:hypothetical protein